MPAPKHRYIRLDATLAAKVWIFFNCAWIFSIVYQFSTHGPNTTPTHFQWMEYFISMTVVLLSMYTVFSYFTKSKKGYFPSVINLGVFIFGSIIGDFSAVLSSSTNYRWLVLLIVMFYEFCLLFILVQFIKHKKSLEPLL